jgi:hypothetical protein
VSGAGPGAEANLVVTVEPSAPLDAVEPVSWFRIAGVEATDAVVNGLALFSGELSSYHLGRLSRRDPPQTLLDRQIPALSFAVEADTVVLAPSQPLATGETYSLASAELGQVAVVVVGERGRPRLRREWPPSGLAVSARRSLFCLEAGERLELAPVVLDGDRGRFDAKPYPDTDPSPRCAALEWSGELSAGTSLPIPPALGDWALPPEPLVHAVSPPPTAVSCGDGEVALGLGCLRVLDDRVELRGPEPASHTILGPGGAGGLLWAGESLVVPGLVPAREYAVRASMVIGDGTVVTDEREGIAADPLPHVVINEVLANAVGPEPQSEWVELFNDGTLSVELGGWTLADAATETSLPVATLGSGEYALIVREDYEPDAELDVAPVLGTRLLRVTELGRGGLANGGELLRLRSPDGVVRSRFPALAAAQAGESVARRHPWLADDDADAFGPHAAPGASPGAENALAE